MKTNNTDDMILKRIESQAYAINSIVSSYDNAIRPADFDIGFLINQMKQDFWDDLSDMCLTINEKRIASNNNNAE